MWTNACSLEEIDTQGMAPVSEEKMRRYAEYYDRKKQYAHGIIVDENNVIMDGYATYLLAKEGGYQPDIMRVMRGQEFRKVVCGPHVLEENGEFTEVSSKPFCWYYALREEVVPGDILYVSTRKGEKLMRVDRIFYVAGRHDCSVHRTARRHTGFSAAK